MAKKENKRNPKFLTYRNKQYYLGDLPQQITLTEIEKKIIKARCSSCGIYSLSKREVDKNMQDLISSCVAIYGFFPPTTKEMMGLLVNEFSNYFLKNGFDHLSYDEFYLALQINAFSNLSIPAAIDAEQVKTFGATVNVKFVSDVMCFYLKLRNLLDRKLENFIDGY